MAEQNTTAQDTEKQPEQKSSSLKLHLSQK